MKNILIQLRMFYSTVICYVYIRCGIEWIVVNIFKMLFTSK
jgi:hypothetical protein